VHVATCRAEPTQRPRLEVADVFGRFGDAYRESHALNRDQARAFAAILACRTAALGGHLDCCEQCGFERPSYNSCRNRHCPKCQGIAAARWVEARKHSILPIHYYHVVFTLPAQLRPLALHNRQAAFELLFKAASETLLTLGADPERLGGLLGLTAVLHTWTRDLNFHPHLHCIVTGGGLTADEKWVNGNSDAYLFPVLVMGRLFRGKFLAGLKQLFDKHRLALSGSCAHLEDRDVFRLLLDRLYRAEWRPYAKRPFAGPEQVYDYLGFYTHRVAISNQRLLQIDQHSVRFKTRGEKSASLKGDEFVRRFLLHVLPRGFVKIRHYGLLSSKAQSEAPNGPRCSAARPGRRRSQLGARGCQQHDRRQGHRGATCSLDRAGAPLPPLREALPRATPPARTPTTQHHGCEPRPMTIAPPCAHPPPTAAKRSSAAKPVRSTLQLPARPTNGSQLLPRRTLRYDHVPSARPNKRGPTTCFPTWHRPLRVTSGSVQPRVAPALADQHPPAPHPASPLGRSNPTD
jgi:hypothetical protein